MNDLVLEKTSNKEMSLARKYRPKNGREYMGSGIREIIRNRFADVKPSEYPNVILLHGTHGCGKTSCARILTLEYLCTNKTEDGFACGKCASCQDLLDNLINAEAGVSVEGVIEVDVGNDSTKSSLEATIEECLIEPVITDYKILILDEFHMADKKLQNSLLKIMEEPPKHLVIMLCTTNPESIIPTIRSRCQLDIKVKKADLKELVDRLEYICQQEGYSYNPSALKLISQKKKRIPRDTLMALEQVAKNNGNRVTNETVKKELIEVADEVYYQYYQSANTSTGRILEYMTQLEEKSIDYKVFIDGLIGYTIECVNIMYGVGAEDYSKEQIKSVKGLLGMYNLSELDYLIQIIDDASDYATIGVSEEKLKSKLITTAMRIGGIQNLNDLSETQLEVARDKRVAKRERGKRIKDEKTKTGIMSNKVVSLDAISSLVSYNTVEVVGEDGKQAAIPYQADDMCGIIGTLPEGVQAKIKESMPELLQEREQEPKTEPDTDIYATGIFKGLMGVSEDTKEDKSNDTSNNTSNNTTEDTSNNTTKDTPEQTSNLKAQTGSFTHSTTEPYQDTTSEVQSGLKDKQDTMVGNAQGRLNKVMTLNEITKMLGETEGFTCKDTDK